MSEAIASWTGRGSGRAALRVNHPRLGPTNAQTSPAAPAPTRNRRRPGSWASLASLVAIAIANRPIPRHEQPGEDAQDQGSRERHGEAGEPAQEGEHDQGERGTDGSSWSPDYRPRGLPRRDTAGCGDPVTNACGAGPGTASRTTVALTFPRSPSTVHSIESSSAGLLEGLVHRPERDHLLDRGAPGDRGGAADLPALLVDGHRGALDLRRDRPGRGRASRTSPRSRPSRGRGRRADARGRLRPARRAAPAAR